MISHSSCHVANSDLVLEMLYLVNYAIPGVPAELSAIEKFD
jgi:hypothetical protein